LIGKRSIDLCWTSLILRRKKKILENLPSKKLNSLENHERYEISQKSTRRLHQISTSKRKKSQQKKKQIKNEIHEKSS
jgi:hypothetical protein